jgi:hypothetical protein
LYEALLEVSFFDRAFLAAALRFSNFCFALLFSDFVFLSATFSVVVP